MTAQVLGTTPEQGALEQSLRFLDLPAPWVIVLIVLPIFGLVTWIGYARESIGTPTRVMLSSLRMGAFALLFLVLARPVLVERRQDVHPAEVLVLLDDSASMQRIDAYSGDPESRRAIERLFGTSPESVSRLELAKRALRGKLLPWLEKGDYHARLFAFSERAIALDDPDSLAGRGAGTHLGDALTQVLAAHRGRPVTDVVVLSDGRSNGGTSIEEAARTAGATGIPVHTVVIGDTRPERNAVIELIEAPGDALQGDELAIVVRVLGRGTQDVQDVRVTLEEFQLESSDAPLPVAEEESVLDASGERVVLVAPAGGPSLGSGERRFRVSIPPLEGETLLDDNQVQFSVHVSPTEMRVLFVDGYPRWEYRYLKNMVVRASREHIRAQCYLLSATRDFPQESSPDVPSLTEVPATREELLENYDVVILGDVNPNAISPDPARCEAFMTAVREFVEAGGGVLFQAGEFNNPRAFIQTPLEDVLPIVLDPTGLLSFEGDAAVEFRPLLEEPNAPHEILRLEPDLEENRRLWETEAGLRGFYWYSPVRRAKPGAQVLLRHPSDRNPQDGELYPLLVTGYYPAGRTMFLALDSTWMWRYYYGDRYHELFWRNAIRWLALGRLKSGDRRYRLETSRSSYDLEERITLEARVLDEDFRPAERPVQKALWSGPEGRPEELELSLVQGRLGVYRGGLQVDRPGLYRAWIELDGKRVTATEFEVRLPSRENADPAPDPAALALLASRTGGKTLPLANLGGLADEFPGGEELREPVSSSLEDAWDNWTTLLVALGLLSVEWVLRKRVELV